VASARRAAPILVAVAALALPSGSAAAATGPTPQIVRPSSSAPSPARHHRDRCRYDDCDDWGGDSGGGDGGGGGGHTGYGGGGGRNGDQDGRGNCHSFCNWTIPGPLPMPGGGGEKPQSLFPPNPAKLGQYIAQFAKLGLDFGQSIATQTIKFVEDLFTILA
jgi:hypothetical protein